MQQITTTFCFQNYTTGSSYLIYCIKLFSVKFRFLFRTVYIWKKNQPRLNSVQGNKKGYIGEFLAKRIT